MNEGPLAEYLLRMTVIIRKKPIKATMFWKIVRLLFILQSSDTTDSDKLL